MPLKSRLFIVALMTALLLAPITSIIHASQQSAQPPAPDKLFEPLITKIRTGLALNEDQVTELRKIFAHHAPKILELRQRAQSQPYSPPVQAEVQNEQRAIRDEITASLNDEQKAKLVGIDTRLPIPSPPAFYLIDIPTRAQANADQGATLELARAEQLIAAVSPTANGRAARLTEDQKILHLLNRIAFGPRPGDLERVRQMGIDKFLEAQLHPETIDDSDLDKRLAVLPTARMTSTELYQFYPPPQVAEQRVNEKNPPPVFGRPQQVIGELIQQKLVRAVSSHRQLQEVMTDFWFNHFNVFAQKDADQWFLTGYERDVIRPHTLGKFRDLLLATAQSPAMLFYLDNWLSTSPDAQQPRPPAPPPPANAGQRGSNPKAAPLNSPAPAKPAEPSKPAPHPPARKVGINENYARELMELHTMGVNGGYTQKDVQEVARCFTGWTIDRPGQGGAFVFRPWMHDTGSKTVLGITIPAGGGISDGERVIEILSRHPSTARFISKKLCQRFVSDNPPSHLVERVARVFLRTDGEMSEVLRAIFKSPEFYSASAFRSKMKSPLELVASAIRAVDGDTNGAPALHDWLRKMGEPLYQYQFPTGYSERSTIWMNTGTFFNRLNFAVALANNQIAGTRYDPARLVLPETTAREDDLMSRLAALVVHTELSGENRHTISAALAEQAGQSQQMTVGHQMPAAGAPVSSHPGLDASATRRVTQIIGLLFGTPDFQYK